MASSLNFDIKCFQIGKCLKSKNALTMVNISLVYILQLSVRQFYPHIRDNSNQLNLPGHKYLISLSNFQKAARTNKLITSNIMIYQTSRTKNNSHSCTSNNQAVSNLQKSKQQVKVSLRTLIVSQQKPSLRTSRVSQETGQLNQSNIRLHSPKFTRKPKTSRDCTLQTQTKNQNKIGLQSDASVNYQAARLRSSEAKQTKRYQTSQQKLFDIPIKFYSPKAQLKSKTKTQYFRQIKQQCQFIQVQKQIEIKMSSQNTSLIEKKDPNQELKLLRQKVKNLEIELKKIEKTSRQKDKQIQKLTSQNKKLARSERQLIQNNRKIQTQLDEGKVQKAQILKQFQRLQNKLQSSFTSFNPQSPQKFPRFEPDQEKLVYRLKQLQTSNQNLQNSVNKLNEQNKYYQIELNMLRKKKNDIVNLQIKNLRLTEKNKQLQTKATRIKTQLDKARSPPKKTTFNGRNRKQSTDSIFSLSPDHSLDEQCR